MNVKSLYRGVAQLGKRAWFGTKRSEVQILSPRPLLTLLQIVICTAHFTYQKLKKLSISYISKKEKHDHFWNLCQEDLNDSN